MNTTKHELDRIELRLDELRVARFKRFHGAALGTILSTGAIIGGSAEGSAMCLCLYVSMAVATVSSQISMTQLKERRETLARIFMTEKERKTSAL